MIKNHISLEIIIYYFINFKKEGYMKNYFFKNIDYVNHIEDLRKNKNY